MDMQFTKLRTHYTVVEEIRCTIHYKGGKTYRITKKVELKDIVIDTLKLQDQSTIDYVTISGNNIYDIANANWPELVNKAILYEHDDLAEIHGTCDDVGTVWTLKPKRDRIKV